MLSDLPIDQSTVESQVEILKSETIALAVIKKLHLADDPEFVGGGGGLNWHIVWRRDGIIFVQQRAAFRIHGHAWGGRRF